VPGPDRRLPFAFVDDLDAPVLPPDDHHHLRRVRRLRDGDRLTIGDGAGRFRTARFGDRLAVDGDVEAVTLPTPPITIAFALTKGDKPELVVQKLVEIGADRIVPFVADRTVIRWDEGKAVKHHARWQVIAREAAAQAHRPHLATVDAVTDFDAVARLPGAALAHPEGVPVDRIEGGPPATVLVGPEGGWSEREEQALPRWLLLGPHVLRAETAALVAGSLAVLELRTKNTLRG
jgi:16S rRNA (uracil1498-N3)-methyltransferase